MSDYYTATGNPASGSLSSSSSMRSEFAAIEDGFDLLPSFSGNAGKYVKVNDGETALEAADLTNIVSGTYSPTITNNSNMTSSTLRGARYIRVSDVVYVTGDVSIAVTAAVSTVGFSISLPVASTFASVYDASGIAVFSEDVTTAYYPTGIIFANVAGGDVDVTIRLNSGEAHTPTVERNVAFTFSYAVL